MLVQRKGTQRKHTPEPPTPPALLAEAGARMTAHPCAACGFALPAQTALTRGLVRLRLRCSATATGPNVNSNTGYRKPRYSLRRVGKARSTVTHTDQQKTMRRNSRCSLRPTQVPLAKREKAAKNQSDYLAREHRRPQQQCSTNRKNQNNKAGCAR